jgi:hypothetical protein
MAVSEPYTISDDLFFKSNYSSPTTIREYTIVGMGGFLLPLDGGNVLLELYTPSKKNFQVVIGDCTLKSVDGRVKVFDGLPITGQCRRSPKVTGLTAGTELCAVFENYSDRAAEIMAGTPPLKETNFGLKVCGPFATYQVKWRNDPGISANSLHLIVKTV